MVRLRALADLRLMASSSVEGSSMSMSSGFVHFEYLVKIRGGGSRMNQRGADVDRRPGGDGADRRHRAVPNAVLHTCATPPRRVT